MNVTTLHRPTHREALWELDEAFERGDMITIFGRCTVDYDGRASSTLSPGDRLLILKPDGSALVHTDEKRTPVNWQPPGCEHRASVRDGRLRVRSSRTSPEETLDVSFEEVHQLSALAVTGGRDLELTGSEEDLRRRILDDPALVEEGFEPIETERPSGAGPIDIFGTDGEGTPVVVELKRRRVGPDAAGQLKRYVDAIERELGDGAVVRGVLVAPSVTDRTAELLEREGLEFVPLTPTAKGGSGDEAGVDGAGVDEPGESNQADADADGTDESNDE